MAPGGGGPGGVREMAGEQMLGGEASARPVVRAHTRHLHLGMVDGEVHHGDVPSAETRHEGNHALAAHGDERAVAGPADREAGEPVCERQVPALPSGEAGDGRHADMRGGADKDEDRVRFHIGPVYHG